MADKKFDFEEFSVAFVRAIDSIRSRGKPVSRDPVEHRINAFYRALGLPALILDEEAPISPNNNGNSFTAKEYGLSEADKNTIQSKFAPRKTPVLIDSDDIENFLDFNEFGILDSMENRKSGNLFPMLVDGNVEVWPIGGRIAPAFSAEEDLVDDRVKFSRPFIETVLSLRIKGEGVNNSETQDQISFISSKEIENIATEILNLLQNSETYIDSVVKTSIERANKVRRFLGADVVPISNSALNQKPVIRENTEKIGELENKRDLQQSEIDKKNARLAIFDFDDNYSGDESLTRNIKDPIFANDFIKIVLGLNQAEKCSKETNEKIEKYKKILMESNKELDLVLGTYSGLSGTDILAIIISMFEVDQNVLIGLLNQTNKKNLKDSRGIENNTISVSDAVSKLEARVKVVLERIDGKIKNTKPNEKTTNNL